MVLLAFGLMVVAVIAGLFGFGVIASPFVGVAQLLCMVFIALAMMSYLCGGPVVKQWRD
jgi:uncharacterized membrane protein YtjA (UPF0391 family)